MELMSDINQSPFGVHPAIRSVSGSTLDRAREATARASGPSASPREPLTSITLTESCRSAVLAVELCRLQARTVVVGSTARWLLDPSADRPRDLDVVVDPHDVDDLVRALSSLHVPAQAVRLLRCREVRFRTGWGPLDVFVRDRPLARDVPVTGVPITVAVEP